MTDLADGQGLTVSKRATLGVCRKCGCSWPCHPGLAPCSSPDWLFLYEYEVNGQRVTEEEYEAALKQVTGHGQS